MSSGEGHGCYHCTKKCQGFLTDREQRKVWGVGILYILGFPILCFMILIGALKANPPGEPNPNCPAEPNIPWFLITGGLGIGILLLLRIALNKCMSHITQKMQCCHHKAGCLCEFSCNLLYDIISMVFIVMWMVTVTWWVFRHKVGPETLTRVLGEEIMVNFRKALGDNDEIYDVQFTDDSLNSYCDKSLFMFAFVLLSLGWIVLLGALIVFIVDKILSKIVCCRLCRNVSSLEARLSNADQSETVHLNKNISLDSAAVEV